MDQDGTTRQNCSQSPKVSRYRRTRGLQSGQTRAKWKALSVRYEGQSGAVLIEGEYTNRKVLGHLKSGLWIASPNSRAESNLPDSWTFRGAGFGHGVGMCQHGAIGMAREGHAFDSILKHYYRGSTLKDSLVISVFRRFPRKTFGCP